MVLPLHIHATWKSVAEKFKDLHASKNDDDRRLATKRGIQTIRARHGEEGQHYICKSQHNTGWDSASKDALAYVEGEAIHGQKMQMHMFDMIDGNSRRTNVWPIHSGEGEAYVLIPGPFDWLSAEIEHPPVGNAENSDLQAQIDEIKRLLDKTFRIGDLITLKTENGKFVCADRDNGNRVIANRDAVGSWEKFKIDKVE